jgi:hypothetical protein
MIIPPRNSGNTNHDATNSLIVDHNGILVKPQYSYKTLQSITSTKAPQKWKFLTRDPTCFLSSKISCVSISVSNSIGIAPNALQDTITLWAQQHYVIIPDKTMHMKSALQKSGKKENNHFPLCTVATLLFAVGKKLRLNKGNDLTYIHGQRLL